MLMMVKRSLIDEGKRYREDYGDLSDLKHSIQERGLIQPIAVQDRGDGQYLLLAGGRRFRATGELGMEDIPVRVYPPDLSEFEKRAIELAENFYRKDMTWQEQVTLQREVHRLYVQAKGVAMPGSSGGWSLADTGNLLGRSKASVSVDMNLADALEKRPELAQLGSKKEALKAIAKAEEQILVAELARRAEARTATGGSFSSEAQIVASYIIGDFFKEIKQVPAKCINLVELDPDFGIEVGDFRSIEMKGYHEVSRDSFLIHLDLVLGDLERVMADHSWLVMWWPFEKTGRVMELLNEHNFTTSVTPGIWIKDDCSHVCRSPQHNLDPQCEQFLVARRGSPVMNRPARASAFFYPRLKAEDKIHPFERPRALMQDIVRTFAHPGSKVLVPFLGSGKTLLAAWNEGCDAFGFELSQEYKTPFTAKLHAQSDEWKMERKK